MEAEFNGPTESRREARIPLDLDGAHMRESGYGKAPVTVRDLSRQGFRTEWPYRLKPGEPVWLTLPGLGSLAAKVAWVKDFEVGCKFDEALHEAVFDALIRAHGDPAG